MLHITTTHRAAQNKSEKQELQHPYFKKKNNNKTKNTTTPKQPATCFPFLFLLLRCCAIVLSYVVSLSLSLSLCGSEPLTWLPHAQKCISKLTQAIFVKLFAWNL